MYLRVLALTLLALPLAGCELPFGKAQASWALINKSKIQAAVSDGIKQSHPYPDELSRDYRARQEEYERANQQISELKAAAMQRCMNLASSDLGKRGNSQEEGRVPVYAIGVPVSPTQGCIRDIEKDQLVLDLREKAKAFPLLQQQRREHDIEVQKIINDTIDAAVDDYARANGFSLIIANEQSIAYSESKQVLEVTSGVIDHIKTH